MAGVLLGRTNDRFPAVWLRPEVSHDRDDVEPLIGAVAEARTVVDVSTAPSFWGRHLPNTPFLAGAALPNQPFAPITRGAYNEIHDAVVSAVFSTGRHPLDFFCLRIASMPEPARLQMAIEALYEAKADGLVKFLGIEASGPASATVAAWQMHDAFELLITPAVESGSPLLAMAAERRVGVAVRGRSAAIGHVRIVGVSTRAEVEGAMREAVSL